MISIHSFHLWRLVADAERGRRHEKEQTKLSGWTPSKPSKGRVERADDEYVTINAESQDIVVTRSELRTMFMLKHRFSIFTRFYALRAFCKWRDTVLAKQLEHYEEINCGLLKEKTQAQMLLKYASWRDEKAVLMKVVSAWAGILHAKLVANLQRLVLVAKCRIFLRTGDVRDPFLLQYWTLWVLQARTLRDVRCLQADQRQALNLAEKRFHKRLACVQESMFEQRELIMQTADAERKQMLHPRKQPGAATIPSEPQCYSSYTSSPSGSPSFYPARRPHDRPRCPQSTANSSQNVLRHTAPHPYPAHAPVYSSSREHAPTDLPKHARRHEVSVDVACRDVPVPQRNEHPISLCLPPRSPSLSGLHVPPRSPSPSGLGVLPRSPSPSCLRVPPRMESFDEPVEREHLLDGVTHSSVASKKEVHGACMGEQCRRSPTEARTSGERLPSPRQENLAHDGFPDPPRPDGPGGKQYAPSQSIIRYVGTPQNFSRPRSHSAPPSTALRRSHEPKGDEYQAPDGQRDSGVPRVVTPSQSDASYGDTRTAGDVRRHGLPDSFAKRTDDVNGGAFCVAVSSPLMALETASGPSLEHKPVSNATHVSMLPLPPSEATPSSMLPLPPGKATSSSMLPLPFGGATPQLILSLPPGKASCSPTPSFFSPTETSSAATTPLSAPATAAMPPPTLSLPPASGASITSTDTLAPVLAKDSPPEPVETHIHEPGVLLPSKTYQHTCSLVGSSGGPVSRVDTKLGVDLAMKESDLSNNVATDALPSLSTPIIHGSSPSQQSGTTAFLKDVASSRDASPLVVPALSVSQRVVRISKRSSSSLGKGSHQLADAFLPVRSEIAKGVSQASIPTSSLSSTSEADVLTSVVTECQALPTVNVDVRDTLAQDEQVPAWPPRCSQLPNAMMMEQRPHESNRQNSRVENDATIYKSPSLPAHMRHNLPEGNAKDPFWGPSTTQIHGAAVGARSLVMSPPTCPSPLMDGTFPPQTNIAAARAHSIVLSPPARPSPLMDKTFPPEIDGADPQARSPSLSPRSSPNLHKTAQAHVDVVVHSPPLAGDSGTYAHAHALREHVPRARSCTRWTEEPQLGHKEREGSRDSLSRNPPDATTACRASTHGWVAPSNEKVPAMGFRIARKAIKVSSRRDKVRVTPGNGLGPSATSPQPTTSLSLRVPSAIESPPTSPTLQSSIAHPRAPATSSSPMLQCAAVPEFAPAVRMGTTPTKQHRAMPVNSSTTRSCTPVRTVVEPALTLQALSSPSSPVVASVLRPVTQSSCQKCSKSLRECLCGNNLCLPGACRVSPGRLASARNIKQIYCNDASSLCKSGPASLRTAMPEIVSASPRCGGKAAYGTGKRGGPALMCAVELQDDTRQPLFMSSTLSHSRGRVSSSPLREEKQHAPCSGVIRYQAAYQRPPSLPAPATRSPCPPPLRHTSTASKASTLPQSGPSFTSSIVSPPTSLTTQSQAPHALSPPTSAIPSPCVSDARSQSTSSTKRSFHPPLPPSHKNADVAFSPVRHLLPPPTMCPPTNTSPRARMELLPPPVLDSRVQPNRGRSPTPGSSTRNPAPSTVTHDAPVGCRSYQESPDARRPASLDVRTDSAPPNGLSPLRTNAPQLYIAGLQSHPVSQLRAPYRSLPEHLFHAPTPASRFPAYVPHL